MNRCYNGCFDSETQRQIDKENAMLKSLKEVEPDAHCTYFPHEGKFQIHIWGKQLSEFHSSRMAALEEALKKVKS